MSKQEATPVRKVAQRVLVCGSRTFGDVRLVESEVLSLVERGIVSPNATIVHGGAKGADTCAGMVGFVLGFEVEVHPADWSGKGKSAGYIRNQEMLESGLDYCIAFIDKPLAESRGTAELRAKM